MTKIKVLYLDKFIEEAILLKNDNRDQLLKAIENTPEFDVERIKKRTFDKEWKRLFNPQTRKPIDFDELDDIYFIIKDDKLTFLAINFLSLYN